MRDLRSAVSPRRYATEGAAIFRRAFRFLSESIHCGGENKGKTVRRRNRGVRLKEVLVRFGRKSCIFYLEKVGQDGNGQFGAIVALLHARGRHSPTTLYPGKNPFGAKGHRNDGGSGLKEIRYGELRQGILRADFRPLD